MPLVKAKEPFHFKTQLSLVEITGLRASTLSELNRHLKSVAPSSIYYHTHHYLQQHQFLTPEPPNDFAYWVSNILQEEVLGEKLAAIDTVRFGELELLRQAIGGAIDAFIQKNPLERRAPAGEEFHFLKCILVHIPTPHMAKDLREFAQCLNQVSIYSLYNHVFEARLRPPLGINDFSHWLSSALGEHALAAKIQKLDPYTHTLEGLRKKIIQLAQKRAEETDAEPV